MSRLPKQVRACLSRWGKQGGKNTSKKKLAAIRKNLAKARAVRWAKKAA